MAEQSSSIVSASSITTSSPPSPVTTSLSTPSASTSPTSTSSSWHGLSSAANQPEAEQALDIANEAFAAGRYYKAERMCLRSIRLYDTPQGNELLRRIYEKIPHARPGAASSSSSSTSSTASASSQQPPSASSSTSAPSSSSSSSSSSSFPFPLSSLPSWLIIPPSHRRPLLVLWSLVLLVALLRYYGVLTALDQPFTPHPPKHYTTHTPRTASSSSSTVGGGSSASVGGWLLGLTNLFPLVLMLLFASGQWQRWLHHQQQQRMQQQPH